MMMRYRVVPHDGSGQWHYPFQSPLVVARNLAIEKNCRVDVYLMIGLNVTGVELIGSFAPDGSVCG